MIEPTFSSFGLKPGGNKKRIWEVPSWEILMFGGKCCLFIKEALDNFSLIP